MAKADRTRVLTETVPLGQRPASRPRAQSRPSAELHDRLSTQISDRVFETGPRGTGLGTQVFEAEVLEAEVFEEFESERFIDVPGREKKSQLCIAGQGLQLAFTPHSGKVVIGSMSTRVGPPGSRPGGVRGKPDADPDSPNADDFAIAFSPTRVQINAPGFNRSFDVDVGTMSGNDPEAELPIVEVDVPPSAAGKLWRVTVFNAAGARSKINVTASYLKDRHRSRLTRVPISLLNGAARELVKGLGLELRVDGGDSFVDFSDDLKRHAGGALRRTRFNAPLTHDINLSTAAVSVGTVGEGSKRQLTVDVFARFEEEGREIVVSGLGVDLAEADLVELGIRTRFTIDRRLGYTASIDAAIGFEGDLVFDVIETGVQLVTGALGALGFGDGSKDFDDFIADLIAAFQDRLNDRAVRSEIQSFLRDGMMQLVERGRRFHDMVVTPTHLLVEHFHPDDADPPKRPPLPRPPAVEPTEDDIADAARVQAGIEHVVVLMLENRSFDHLLGYLSLPSPIGPGRTDVDGLRGDETNRAIGVTVTADLIDDTAFPFSPDHGVDGVARQIHDGEMNGFLADFIRRFGNNTTVDRHHPLQYYNDARMPTYGYLTEHYTVCDRWFCTHPGPTWPNRFCTFSGQTPEIHNLDLDDPRLGYIDFATVFDLLDRDEWRVYESDVSFLRMYDRYRLDDRNIRPIASFADDVADGLPMFTFIEPDYTDVIPIDRVANDDHPPVDLRNGQRLVRWIYDTLRKAPTWRRTLFVITYDEHGGFFDHVPPAGLPVERASGDSADVGPLPLVHPDGFTFTGPRVPTIVMSPWVDAGATSVLFEHTSIAKTVLQLRHGAAHPDLGPRVSASRGLGAVLRGSPRETAGPIRPDIEIPPIDPGKPGRDLDLEPDRDDRRDFHEAMRRFGTPA